MSAPQQEATYRAVLETALAEIEKLPKLGRTEAALDRPILDAAIHLGGERSPSFAWLLAKLSAIGVKIGLWKLAFRGRIAEIAPAREAPKPTNGHRFERGDHAELARETLHELGGLLTFDAGQFWRYSEARGIWDLIPDHQVRHVAAGFAGELVGDDMEPLKVKLSDVRGAEALARDELLTRPERVTFDEAPPGIAFRNGFVTVTKGRIDILPHAPEHRARFAYPFDYVPWQTQHTPLLLELLESFFADCSEAEAAARSALFQEFIGACLVGCAVDFQQALFLHGEGGNGKSTILNVARALFPRDAIAAIPPQRWSERFSLAGLEGKRANFVDETPSSEILEGNAFKAVITGGVVRGERKHRDGFDFVPRAGHIFSTNWPITTTDHTAGFWRRPIILPFTRRFDDSPERRRAPEAAIISNELAGVVAWSLDGAARAQAQNAYTLPDQSRALATEWRDQSDQIRIFLATRDADDVVPADNLYKRYREWATDNGHKCVTSTLFGRRVMASGLYTRDEAKSGRIYKRKREQK